MKQAIVFMNGNTYVTDAKTFDYIKENSKDKTDNKNTPSKMDQLLAGNLNVTDSKNSTNTTEATNNTNVTDNKNDKKTEDTDTLLPCLAPALGLGAMLTNNSNNIAQPTNTTQP